MKRKIYCKEHKKSHTIHKTLHEQDGNCERNNCEFTAKEKVSSWIASIKFIESFTNKISGRISRFMQNQRRQANKKQSFRKKFAAEKHSRRMNRER